MRHRAWIIGVAVGCLAASCATDGGDDSQQAVEVEIPDELASTSTTSAQPVPESAEPFTAGRFFDEDLETTPAPEAYYVPYYTARDLADDVDYVFLGRIVDTAESVYQLDADPEDPDKERTVDYDGAVFEVDEVLVGDLAVGQSLTIGIPAVVTSRGEQRRYDNVEQVEVIQDGLERSNDTYLVFAVLRRDSGKVAFFYGNNGVVRVPPDGGPLVGLPGSYYDTGDVHFGKAGALTLEDIRVSLEGPPGDRFDLQEPQPDPENKPTEDDKDLPKG